MYKKSNTIQKVQESMKKFGSGFLILINLSNKYELEMLIDDMDYVIEKYYEMVKIACSKVKEYDIIETYDLTKIIVVISSKNNSCDPLVNSIHSQIQLYIDENFPELYIRCSTGSIKFFSEDHFQEAGKMVSQLGYGICEPCHTYSFYSSSPLNIEKLREENIEMNILRNSLLNNKAKFAYQAIVSKFSGEVEYYECLLRLPDKDGNLVSVGEIIERVEKKGLINIIDRVVIDMAVNELSLYPDLKLSVNISNLGILDRGLFRHIKHMFKRYDVAHRLIIEITETSLNHDFARTADFISELKKYGCRFALDDFGSGFTSINQLMKLPFDIIKLDGSLISDLLDNKYNQSIVKNFAAMAKELKIKTVAEYVENGEIAKYLSDLDIDSLQGNFFSPASTKRMD